MAKIKQACVDAGPFIHLDEIKSIGLLGLFVEIVTSKEVISEHSDLSRILSQVSHVRIKDLSPQSRDFAKYLCERYELDLGEATVMGLCKQEYIRLFFTDDLDARTVAQILGFEPHGTLAIILRAFREGILSYEQVKERLQMLWQESSLFLTKDLLKWTLAEIESFKKVSFAD